MCVCVLLCPSFCKIIHLISFVCIRMFFSYTCVASQSEFVLCVCACVNCCALLSAKIFILSFRCIGICASFFLAPHPRAIVCVNVCVCVCVCALLCPSCCEKKCILCHSGVFACMSLLLVQHRSASVLCVCVCTWLCLSFCTIINRILYGRMCLFFWGHIPERVYVCVCMAVPFILPHH